MTALQNKDYGPLHPETTLGPVHYNVVNLERMTSFYKDIVGMKVLRQEADFAVLGTDERELLHMSRVDGRGGGPALRSRPTTGLYHTAFLVPTKRDLAYLTLRLIDTRTPVQGTSDHGTHLAIYLPDPEGNGIELAWDYPRERWPKIDGQLDFTGGPRRGVDVDDLLRTIEDDDEPWRGVGADTAVGHIHLHVADLEGAKDFYNRVLGFDVIIHSPAMGASFLSAGGYHHHVGMNIWKGRGLPPAEPGAPGLRYFTVLVPDEEELQRVEARAERAGNRGVDPFYRNDVSAGPHVWITDPSGIRMLVRAADSGAAVDPA